jgi:hypothetical protein
VLEIGESVDIQILFLQIQPRGRSFIIQFMITGALGLHGKYWHE